MSITSSPRLWVRPPAVAGRFYPGDPHELAALVDDLLAQAHAPEPATPAPKAIIAPHAGYVFSGAVAAKAYKAVAPAKDRIRRVVMIGPAHTARFYGLATSSARAFATPLGEVTLDQAGIARACRACPMLTVQDAAHEREHDLEVQLPFLQRTLDAFELVPMVFGMTSAGDVASVLEELWGGEETLIVISSDLSHYHDAQTAARLDTATAEAIEAMLPYQIGEEQACGRLAIQGLLVEAQSHGLSPARLDLRHSGQTAPHLGPREQVVGYGAWSFARN